MTPLRHFRQQNIGGRAAGAFAARKAVEVLQHRMGGRALGGGRERVGVLLADELAEGESGSAALRQRFGRRAALPDSPSASSKANPAAQPFDSVLAVDGDSAARR